MPIPYDEMIKPGVYLRPFFRTSPCDVTKSHGFINYEPKTYAPEQDDRMFWWKFHISIHPDDLTRAWDILFPILEKQAHSFKVINKAVSKKKRTKHHNYLCQAQACLDDLTRLFPDFKMTTTPDAPEHRILLKTIAQAHSMKTLYPQGFPAEREKRAKQLLYQFLFAEEGSIEANRLLKNHYIEKYQIAVTYLDALITECQACLDASNRFNDGMQITIYIPPEETEHYQLLAEHLSLLLYENDIRPGLIHRSDRVLGQYISLRHSGLGRYVEGIDAESYNPSGLDDVFKPVKGIKTVNLSKALRGLLSSTLKYIPFPFESMSHISLQSSFQLFTRHEPVTQIKRFERKALMFSYSTSELPETGIVPLRSKLKKNYKPLTSHSCRSTWFTGQSDIVLSEDETVSEQQLVLRLSGG